MRPLVLVAANGPQVCLFLQAAGLEVPAAC
jgi:hypothetical protein